ncbi:hypothetical protein HDU76_005186 [Blyttiomyces sp. JEL0837]|nr:hypothetical protein HDU76_005186 [Blyttiomyces sp. JEL0837]
MVNLARVIQSKLKRKTDDDRDDDDPSYAKKQKVDEEGDESWFQVNGDQGKEETDPYQILLFSEELANKSIPHQDPSNDHASKPNNIDEVLNNPQSPDAWLDVIELDISRNLHPRTLKTYTIMYPHFFDHFKRITGFALSLEAPPTDPRILRQLEKGGW